MTRFDDELRSTLRTGTPAVDADAFLAGVHRGARRRRQRRAAGVAAAVVLVVAGTAGTLLPGRHSDRTPPVAGTSTPAPTASPAAPRPTAGPTEVPTDDSGRPLETGVSGFDTAARGTLWRVSAVGCGPVALCSRVSSYDGAGRWTPVATLAFAHPRAGEAQAPAEHVTVSADGQDLWVYGREVWSSHDAGRTWTRLHLPFERTGAGEVAVVGGTAVLRTDDGHLLRSPVGADAWQPMALPANMTYAEQVAAVGDTLLVRGRDAGFTLTIATSTDGGHTWTPGHAPCNEEQPAYVVVGGSVLAFCTAAPGGPTAPALVVRSDDAGRSWQPVVTVRVKGNVDAIVPMDKSAVYVVTDAGELVVFAGGEKQYGEAVPLGKTGTVIAGRFVTPQHGYLLLGSPRSLLETTDGGRTWRPIG